MAPESEPRYLAHTLATLYRVREEIDAIECSGAVGALLDEAASVLAT